MHKFGTVAELEKLELIDRIPQEVYKEALKVVAMLDENFGEDRDVDFDDGGYVCVVENEKDLDYFAENCVELESPTLEYVEHIQTDKELYLNAFFLVNEYESVVTLFIPVSIAPDRLTKEAKTSPVHG